MRQFIYFLWAIALFVGGIFGLLACLGYHPADESLNTVSDTAIRNLMGGYGAVVADILWQGFGKICWLVVCAPIA